MELKELFKLLLRNKYYLLIIPLISASIAFVLRFKTDRVYISEAQISTGLTIANDVIGENRALSPFEIALNFGNTTANMSSKMVVNRLSYKILLKELSTRHPYRSPSFKGLKTSYPKGDTLDLIIDELSTAIDNFRLINKTSETGRYIYSLLEIYEYDEKNLLSNINIYRVGNTDFINLRFSSEIASLSSYVVNLWADSFVEFHKYQQATYLNQSLEVLSQILAEKQNLLNQKTKELNTYKTRYLYRSAEAENDPIGEYERLIRDKESNLRSLNFRLQNIREKITNLDHSSSLNGRRRIVGLKKEIDRLSTRLISEGNNKDVTDSIEFLRTELQSQMYLHASSGTDKNELNNLFSEENELKVEYQIALADLQKLKSQYQVEKGMVQNLAANKSLLDNLETQVQQAREEFISAQDKLNQARSKLIVGTGAIKLSYYGDIPQDPQSRKTIIFTGAGLIGGFVLTLFTILAFEFLDFRLKNVFKFERATGFKPAEQISTINGFTGQLDDIISGNYLNVPNRTNDKFLQITKKIRFTLSPNKYSRTVLFTSLREQTGKSFILSSMAHSFSLLEKRILIFDTNFRNSHLSKSLTLQDHKEEKNLQKKVKMEGNIDFSNLDFISKTNNKNIDIIHGQIASSTPEEVFAKTSLGKLLELLEENYDLIFLEGAAINSFSDSRELIKYVNKVICVHSADKEFNEVDKESLQFLSNAKDKILINILNKMKNGDII